MNLPGRRDRLSQPDRREWFPGRHRDSAFWPDPGETILRLVRSKSMYAATALSMKPLPEFADIYQEHYRRVFNLCRYLLNSEEAAEDAAQEVFVKLTHRLESYDAARPMSNWILKIASNHCLDLLRRHGTARRLFGWEAAEPSEVATSRPGPLGQLLDDERGERVRQALGSLPEKYRLPLVLSYYNEFSYDEVALVLGTSRNTVATLLYRGKKLLRRKLLAEEGDAS